MRLLVCDDDETLRAVLRHLAESSGHTVVAEVESSLEAETYLDRVTVDAMIVDLSLRFGSGRDVLEMAVQRGCPAIVFTAFGDAAEAADLPGRPLVVRKPDFDALERALAELVAAPAISVSDRRRSPQRCDPMRIPAALDEPHVFYDVLARATSGDILLAVELDTSDPAQVDALTRTTRAVVRAQDRVMQSSNGVFVLLMATTASVGEKVEGRLVDAWAAEPLACPLTMRRTLIAESEQPADAFARLRRPGGHDALVSRRSFVIAESAEFPEISDTILRPSIQP